jgi:hypothetical protein
VLTEKVVRWLWLEKPDSICNRSDGLVRVGELALGETKALLRMRRARCRHCLVRPFAKIDLGGFCISPQILPHVVSRIVAAECRSPWAVLSPPSALQAARSRRLNARFENRSPEYPANTNCDAANAITPGARMQRPLNFSWRIFHSRSAQAPRG